MNPQRACKAIATVDETNIIATTTATSTTPTTAIDISLDEAKQQTKNRRHLNYLIKQIQGSRYLPLVIFLSTIAIQMFFAWSSPVANTNKCPKPTSYLQAQLEGRHRRELVDIDIDSSDLSPLQEAPSRRQPPSEDDSEQPPNELAVDPALMTPIEELGSDRSPPSSVPGAGGATEEAGNDTGLAKCSNPQEIIDSIPPESIRFIFFSLYGLIFAIGLLGNTLTLCAMKRKRRDRFSIIDIFIANLALSDIMLCLFAVPITPIYLLYHGHWVFGPVLCKALAFAQGSSVYISTFTMITIAHLRYRLIVHPLSESMSVLTAILLNVLTWILGFIVTLPYLMHVSLLPEHCSIRFCDESWDREMGRFWFSVTTIILQFCLPFTAVSFFYGSIFWKLRQQRRSMKALTMSAKATTTTLCSSSASGMLNNQHLKSTSTTNLQGARSVESNSARLAGPKRAPAFQLERETHSAFEPEVAHYALVSSRRKLSASNTSSQVHLQRGVQINNNKLQPADCTSSSNSVSPAMVAGVQFGDQAATNSSTCSRSLSIELRRVQDEDWRGLDESDHDIIQAMNQRQANSNNNNNTQQISTESVFKVNTEPTSNENLQRAAPMVRPLLQVDGRPLCKAAGGALRSRLAKEGVIMSGTPTTSNYTVATSTNNTFGRASGLNITAVKEQRVRDRNRRAGQTNRKLLFMVVLFVFSWLPLNSFNLVQDYSETISELAYTKYVFLIVHLIACSSVCYNPILYAWMSDNYRQELMDLSPKPNSGCYRLLRALVRPFELLRTFAATLLALCGPKFVEPGVEVAERCGEEAELEMEQNFDSETEAVIGGAQQSEISLGNNTHDKGTVMRVASVRRDNRTEQMQHQIESLVHANHENGPNSRLSHVQNNVT